MTSERTISRRLIVCGIPAASAVCCAIFSFASVLDSDAIAARTFALSVISNRTAARATAKTYLAQASPAEVAELLSSLKAGLREETISSTRDAARRLAKRLVESDFHHARIAIVDGWRLSDTEVALCVFANLSK